MMRTGVAALGALSLINLAAAKPSGHHRRHQQLHEKRQDVDVVYETDYSYVTTQLPNVVVFVDENGAPYSTSTEGQAPATAAATSVVVASSAPVAAQAATSSTSVYVAPSPTTLASVYKAQVSKDTTQAAASTTQAPASTSQAAASSSKVASSSAAASSSASSKSGSGPNGYGIVYSPYRDDGGCKSQDEVNSDFSKIHSFAQSNGDDWGFVRTYGVDCNQVSTVLSACKDYDLKLFAGIYNVNTNDDVNSDLKVLIDAVNGDWSRIDTIAIGNEVVNAGKITAKDVGDRVNTAKSTLGSAGYTGSIVAVDTLVAMIANAEELCQHSDYIAVNSHPFFDGSVAAEDSGPWLLEQMQRVSSACSGKDVWIAETGWPTQGNTNGVAVPSTENQKAAISSIKGSISSNLIWFTAFNDMWKQNSASTFNAEQYWGICN